MENTNKFITSWLQLAKTPGITPLKGWNLIRKFGCVENVLEHLPNKPSLTQIEDDLAFIHKKKCWIIDVSNEDFPNQLKQIADCPFVLYGKGNQNILKKQQIGIVGARNASLIGKRIAEHFAKELGKNGIVITSGLAKGIDASAHLAALENGTIAVMAGGVDHIYPSSHYHIYEKIIQNGAVISEMPLNHEPVPYLFPKRNRIIAGLSLGIIVVEAALNSGSLHTAKAALEYGREIFAVPGSPMDPRCRGTNNLIKQGAFLIEDINDVLDVIKVPVERLARAEKLFNPLLNFYPTPFENLRSVIIDALSSAPISFDDLVMSINASASEITAEITLLEIEGIIKRDHDLLTKV